MGTLHHMPERIAVNVGAILTKAALAIRLGRSVGWVTGQGVKVRGQNGRSIETWEASFKNGGRLAGYTLLTLLTLQDPADETKGAQLCAG